jgi:hypothetical protein
LGWRIRDEGILRHLLQVGDVQIKFADRIPLIDYVGYTGSVGDGEPGDRDGETMHDGRKHEGDGLLAAVCAFGKERSWT